MDRYALTLLALLGSTGFSRACDCSIEIPGTFCETMDPAWIEPDIVVLGVKLDEVYYGMRVRVVQVFDGTVAEGDTITVWGDNGALCRWYVGTWANGDTALWGFNNTDFLGNEITAGFPEDLEQPGDYHISFCGTYWLPYANGLITGDITVDGGNQSATPAEFAQMIAGCSSTGIANINGAQHLQLVRTEGGVRVSADASWSQGAVVEMLALDGRVVMAGGWSGGAPFTLPEPSTAGVYLIRIREGERQAVARWPVR